MAGKTKRASGRRRTTKSPRPNPIGIIVRRGARRRFEALKQKTAELPVVVSWDRRKGERRASNQPVAGDRRQSDRRQAPPFTWTMADFVLVDDASDPAPRGKSKAKKS